ncbi:MAG: universal stress protein [Lactobacillaceae bacterium]|jgi:nucleotide-binding universal stress UspA family protein|nr:universal stress protein [Lactobacillaceae bacterium]
MVKEKSFKHVLVAVDESEQGQFALVNAIHQAMEDQARLTIVSVFEPESMNVADLLDHDSVEDAQKRVEDNLQTWAKQAEKAGVEKVDVIYADGNPGEVIVNDVIPQSKADLVVVGAHSKNNFARQYFGSQASYIANRAPISVLVVRQAHDKDE